MTLRSARGHLASMQRPLPRGTFFRDRDCTASEWRSSAGSKGGKFGLPILRGDAAIPPLRQVANDEAAPASSRRVEEGSHETSGFEGRAPEIVGTGVLFMLMSRWG